MKRKLITLGAATLVSSIIFGHSSYSQSIELFTKNNEKYIPVKLFVKKLGGQYKEMEDGYTFNVNGKNIAVKEYASFAKIDDHYEPLKVTEVDGWNVPTDTESIYQEDEVYIPAMFLQSFQVADYSIRGNDLVVEKEKVVVKAPVIVDKPKESNPKPTPVYSPKPQPKPPVDTEQPKEEDNKDDTDKDNENVDPKDQNTKPNDGNGESENTNPNPQEPPQQTTDTDTIIPNTNQ